ncbi:MAG: pyridoxamine 5'-phosphate oxidase family protein [Desulfobacterales bacterium]|nr:pyridoxamine 5'-phosphate oxidase family protein [Desulfobacterales bacterium]
MRDDIKTLIRSQQHCVLATAVDGLPYCSLMAYATEKDCTRFIMVTHRQTRKFQNISRNPRVSLLIDSRETPRPQAVTIEGSGEEIIAEADREAAAGLLLASRPELGAFIRQPHAVFIRITAESAVFLNGLTDAYREQIE